MQLNKLDYFYADRQMDVCEKENGNVAESWMCVVIFFLYPRWLRGWGSHLSWDCPSLTDRLCLTDQLSIACW
jgi:hypothetical protein